MKIYIFLDNQIFNLYHMKHLSSITIEQKHEGFTIFLDGNDIIPSDIFFVEKSKAIEQMVWIIDNFNEGRKEYRIDLYTPKSKPNYNHEEVKPKPHWWNGNSGIKTPFDDLIEELEDLKKNLENKTVSDTVSNRISEGQTKKESILDKEIAKMHERFRKAAEKRRNERGNTK
jgi:hypothetical protein